MKVLSVQVKVPYVLEYIKLNGVKTGYITLMTDEVVWSG
jgi:hypothetical protein